MNLNNLSKEQIEAIYQEAKQKLDELEKDEYRELVKINKIKLDKLRENRDLILSLVNHSRTTCSDYNHCNGWNSAVYGARCKKCHLIEVLDGDWGSEFEVYFDVNIGKIQ